MSNSNCCFLTCMQISQEAGKVVWYSHLLKSFPHFIVIHTVKGFGIVNKAEVGVFLELSCFFYDPTDVRNLVSGSSDFSKSNLNIWKFSVYLLLKSCLENFEHYFANMWAEGNCAVVWTFFWHCLSLGLEGKLTFSNPFGLLSKAKIKVVQESIIFDECSSTLQSWVPIYVVCPRRNIWSNIWDGLCLYLFGKILFNIELQLHYLVSELVLCMNSNRQTGSTF